METHLSWIRVTAAAAVAAVGLSGTAAGQYIPYNGVPQYGGAAPYGTQPQQRPAYQPTQQQAAAPAQTSPYAARPQYPTQQPYQAPQYQAPTAATQPWTRPGQPAAGAQPIAQQPYGQQPMNVAMMRKDEPLPSPEPAMNGNMMNGNGGMMDSSVMTGQPSYDGGYNGNGGSYDGSQAGYQQGCNGSSPYPSTGGYPSSGCTDGGYGGGYYSSCGTDYGVGNSFDSSCGGTQWFGGVYYLFMTRDNPDFRRLTIEVDSTDPDVSYPYYPTPDATVLSMPHVDHDYRSGYEVRFGSTFSTGGGCDTGCGGYGDSGGYGGAYAGAYGYGGCEPCGCAPTQDYAWEFGYWILDDDINTALAVDDVPTDTSRMYGMKNFAGLEYDRDGAGVGYAYRPVNDYYDYQIPVDAPVAPAAGDVRVLAQRVRTNFKAQNLELNFLRLPMTCGSTCGTSSCGSDQCGGYSGSDSCSSCEPVMCGSPFSLVGLCGVRYVRLDDDVEYATEFGEYAGGGPTLDNGTYDGFDYASDNELFYDVNVDNHLTGFQLGANMNYCVSCKCNLFWDTNFGIYNNHMNSYQRVYTGGDGAVRFVGSTDSASVRTDKDDIAFLGEMRFGGSYNFTCHWRGMIAYRAIGLSGVALSVDQMDNDFANEQQLGLIDSDGSLVIHGVQIGAECRY